MLAPMKWGKRWTNLLRAGCALALLSACTGSETERPATVRPAGAESAPDFRPVSDIPIPEGASLDNERSLILSSRDQWTGRIVMKVGQSPSKAFAFYQREMPAFRWNPVMSVQSEISVLTFIREDRAATIQVQPRTIGGALVIVTIAPRQAGQPAAIKTLPLNR
jgi:hypothetical protein